jgi:hypothetical protein
VSAYQSGFFHDGRGTVTIQHAAVTVEHPQDEQDCRGKIGVGDQPLAVQLKNDSGHCNRGQEVNDNVRACGIGVVRLRINPHQSSPHGANELQENEYVEG